MLTRRVSCCKKTAKAKTLNSEPRGRAWSAVLVTQQPCLLRQVIELLSLPFKSVKSKIPQSDCETQMR